MLLCVPHLRSDNCSFLETLVHHGTFCLLLKAWLEILYSFSDAITANLLKVSDYLLIFIVISHPADEETLSHRFCHWLQISELQMHCYTLVTESGFLINHVGVFACYLKRNLGESIWQTLSSKISQLTKYCHPPCLCNVDSQQNQPFPTVPTVQIYSNIKAVLM